MKLENSLKYKFTLVPISNKPFLFPAVVPDVLDAPLASFLASFSSSFHIFFSRNASLVSCDL